jgi:hypothetical protein
MPLLRLTVDQHTSELWNSSKRRLLAAVSSGIRKLEWSYRVAEGGQWDGVVVCKLNPDGKPYDDLVRRGLSGVARIWWVRDETDSTAVDDEAELLWMGLAEDAKVVTDSSLVELKLRGVGQFLETVLITRDFSGRKLGLAVQDVMDDIIAATGSPVTAKDVDLGGVASRRVSLEYDRTPADRVLRELAELAGGPGRVCWGIRTDTDSADMGTGYFKLWTGHLWEKDSGTEDRIFSIPGQWVRRHKTSTISSDIVNAVTVVGAEIKQRQVEADRRFYEASVEAADSVKRFGRREKFLEDSGLRSDGQCALVAAAMVKERGNRRMEVDLELQVPLKDRLTASGEYHGLLQRTLKWPGTLTVVRDEEATRIPWGDTQNVYHAVRATGAKNYLSIDVGSAPTGSDAPLFDLTAALGSTDKRLYLLLNKRPTLTAPLVGVNVIELEGALGAAWVQAGANWRLAILKKDASGTWVSVGTSTAFTAAQLAEEHTIGIVVEYQSATQFKVSAYLYRVATGTTNIFAATNIAHSTIWGSSGQTRIYVNAAGSTGIDTFPAGAYGDSQELELGYLAVLRDWSGTVTALMDDIALQAFPFRRYGDLVLHTNFGQTKAGKGLVRYAYGQTTRTIGFDADPKGNSSESVIQEETSAFTSFRSYSWLLGNELASRVMGTHLELLPFKGTVRYGGPEAPLRVRLSGETGSRLATEAIRGLGESIAKAQENQRNA